MSFPTQMLQDLGTIYTGSTPKTNDESLFGGDIPFVTPGDLGEITPIHTATRSLTEEGAKTGTLLPAGAVLVCCIGSLGKIGFAGRPLVTNQQINAIVFDGKKIDPRYGFFACRLLKPQLESMAPATTVPIVNKSRFSELKIPVPPLEEQRRIAAILDQAETLRTQRRTALALQGSLSQSLFLDMFGDPVANPKGWSMSPLADASDEIQIGPFGSLLHQEDYVPDGIPLINPMHIKDGKIVPGLDQGITQQKFDELPIYQLKAGDLVMGRRGEMGRCAIVTAEHGPLMCGTGSLYIRPNATTATATYLFHVLTSASMKAKLEEFSLGATMPNLNRGIVAGLRVSLPPLPLQQTFATRIASIEALKTTHRRAQAALDALFASLQQRAFTGAL